MHLDVFFPYFMWLLYVRMLTLTDVLISEILIRGQEWTQWLEEIVPDHFIVAFSSIITLLTIMDLARTKPDHIQLW